MNVLLIGDVCIDHNVSENAQYSSAGGASMFMNRIFTKFPDVSATIVSHYGADYLPYLKGISLYPSHPDMLRTLVYENHVQKTGRTQRVYSADLCELVLLNEELLGMIKNADVIVLAPLLPHFTFEYVQEILNASKNDALKVLLPQGYFRTVEANGSVVNRKFSVDDDIIPLFDVVIVSEEDHPDIALLTKKWLRIADVKIIVTMGANGAQFISRSESYSVPTKPISQPDIVDSVGSGDIFSASFMYEYVRSHDIRKSIEFGNTIAGQSLAYTPDQLESAHFTIN